MWLTESNRNNVETLNFRLRFPKTHKSQQTKKKRKKERVTRKHSIFLLGFSRIYIRMNKREERNNGENLRLLLGFHRTYSHE